MTTDTNATNVRLRLPEVADPSSYVVFTEAVEREFRNEDSHDVQVIAESHISDLDDLDLTSDEFNTDDDTDDCIEMKVETRPLQSQGSSLKMRYCPHCNKTFRTQYKFENHSYIHRKMAAFRCILCTNMYNTKQSLIRHYRGMHKYIPTRDMVQAKGEKFSNIAQATTVASAATTSTTAATVTNQTQTRMQTRMQTQRQMQSPTIRLSRTRFRKTNSEFSL